ncbi:MAG TPA: hypothetical protein DCQ93_06565 [Bacteroidetes bacterium]|nr:hypothetical protein [Bacteroidota bacterium]
MGKGITNIKFMASGNFHNGHGVVNKNTFMVDGDKKSSQSPTDKTKPVLQPSSSNNPIVAVLLIFVIVWAANETIKMFKHR